jgi:hypothetical protein
MFNAESTSLKTSKYQENTMCVTNQRISMICGHAYSYTKPCKQQTGNKFLNLFRTACRKRHEVHNYWEICADCRCTWRVHEISEIEAEKKYLAYRQEHKGYHGTLTPYVPLSRDIALIREGQKAPIQEEQWNEYRKGMERFRTGNGEEQRPETSASHKTSSSEHTIWESFYVKNPAKAEPIHKPAEMELEIVYQGISLESADIGEQALSSQLRDQPRKEMADPKRFDFSDSNSGFMPIDLDKPLPPPPRCDSPMPGRPFDSQNPDRYLPRSKYYPRFI